MVFSDRLGAGHRAAYEPAVEIILGAALDVLPKLAAEGRKFDFIFIAITELALSVAGFVKLHIRRFAVKLHVLYPDESLLLGYGVLAHLCLFLSYHNRGLEMQVDNHE